MPRSESFRQLTAGSTKQFHSISASLVDDEGDDYFFFSTAGVIRVGSASVKIDDGWFQEISGSGSVAFELDSGSQGNVSSTYRTIQPVVPLQPT